MQLGQRGDMGGDRGRETDRSRDGHLGCRSLSGAAGEAAGADCPYVSEIVLGIHGLKLKELRFDLDCLARGRLRNNTVKNAVLIRKTPTRSHYRCICTYFCTVWRTTFHTGFSSMLRSACTPPCSCSYHVLVGAIFIHVNYLKMRGF